MVDDVRRRSGPPRGGGLTRRELFRGAGAVAAAGAVLGPVAAAFAEGTDASIKTQGPGAVELTLRVNGETRKVSCEPRETLLDVLRLPLDVTGPKRACDRGSCGACTILLDGLTVNACMMLAVDAEGRTITTVEGLAAGEGRALVDAFVRRDALQCGFCTPGMLTSCAAAVAVHGAGLTKEQARSATAGNLCRCGTYPHVLEAALDAAKLAVGRR